MLLQREGVKKIMCKAAHVIHGLIAGFVAMENLALSVFLYIQFLAYETVEWRIKRDRMYPELREWAIGFVIGLLIYLSLFLS